VLGDRRTPRELLLGRPLSETLRWHHGPDGLSWRHSQTR